MDLKEARFKKRVTEWTLSKISQVHQSRISLIENGHDEANEREKKALAKALGIKVEDVSWPNN